LRWRLLFKRRWQTRDADATRGRFKALLADIPAVKIEKLCLSTDILVVADGKAGLVKRDWIKPGAVVMDVGLSRVEHDGARTITGDVEFAPFARLPAPSPRFQAFWARSLIRQARFVCLAGRCRV
jgi:hypothetical protein